MKAEPKYLAHVKRGHAQTAVRGALTGVWEVRAGTPFVTDPNHDKIAHDPK